jgi:hypothetical protein
VRRNIFFSRLCNGDFGKTYYSSSCRHRRIGFRVGLRRRVGLSRRFLRLSRLRLHNRKRVLARRRRIKLAARPKDLALRSLSFRPWHQLVATTKTDRRNIARYVGICQRRELRAAELITEPTTAGHQHVHSVRRKRVTGGRSRSELRTATKRVRRKATETAATCCLRQAWIKSGHKRRSAEIGDRRATSKRCRCYRVR